MGNIRGKSLNDIMTLTAAVTPKEGEVFDSVFELYRKFGEIRAQIEKDVPSSRECSLVLTKLDEAVLWLGMAPLS